MNCECAVNNWSFNVTKIANLVSAVHAALLYSLLLECSTVEANVPHSFAFICGGRIRSLPEGHKLLPGAII